MKKGVIYIYWGNKHENELNRSVESVKKLGYNSTVFKLDDKAHYGHKALMYDRSPYDLTLFLDTDTILLDNIDFGFRMAEKHGIAVSIAPACFARRFVPEMTDEIEYNTGVVFFAKNNTVKRVFDTWKKHAEEFPRSDQSSFAKAIYENNFNPFVLPQNFNLRAGIAKNVFGPIKIWHSRLQVPKNVEDWNRQKKPRFGHIAKRFWTTRIERKSMYGMPLLKRAVLKIIKKLWNKKQSVQ